MNYRKIPGLEIYATAAIPRKAGGTIVLDGHEAASTVQCCHCGTGWIWVRGSGRRRGFCTRCMAVTCGSRECSKHCLPYERRMELEEQGVDLRKLLE